MMLLDILGPESRSMMLFDSFEPSEESFISCLIFALASPSDDFREISGPEAFA